MKNAIVVVVVLLMDCCLTPPASHACTVCHSKNPTMVRMHEALEYKNCFLCHGPGAKRTGADPKKEMVTSDLCVRCHKK